MNLDAVCFYSNDIERSVEFYTDILGLSPDFQISGKFASFKFENGVNLAIKKAVEKREIPGAQTLFIKSENAKDDYKKIKAKGLSFHKELTEESYGIEFAILDPDKNKIEFIQRSK